MKNYRSPLALARDAYLDSREGQDNCDPATLGADPMQRRFLRNRIELAWMAGAQAALLIEAQKGNAELQRKAAQAAEELRP